MDQQQSSSTQGAKDTVNQVANKAADKTSQVAHQAQDAASNMLEQRKSQAAGSLGTIADALRQTGQHLQDQDQGTFGQFAQRAAEEIDNFSNDLQNKSVGEMMDGVQNFARRDPQLFLGGAVVLGLLAARFLKASGQRQTSSQDNWQGDRYRSYPSQGSTGYSQGRYRTDYGDAYTTGSGSSYRSGSSSNYGTGESGTRYGTGTTTGGTGSSYTTGGTGSDADYTTGADRGATASTGGMTTGYEQRGYGSGVVPPQAPVPGAGEDYDEPGFEPTGRQFDRNAGFRPESEDDFPGDEGTSRKDYE
jgi:hypothetical protein